MLKKLLTACAGILICGTTAFAGDLDGVFVGHSNGQPAGVAIVNTGSRIRGVLSLEGENSPISGQLGSDGLIHGIWNAPDGQQVPFVASENGSSFRIQIEGEVISFSRRQSNAPAPQQQEQAPRQQEPAPVRPAPRQAPSANVGDVQMVQGAVFRIPVPAGWQQDQTAYGAWANTPDKTSMIGLIGMERIKPMTPMQFFNFMNESCKVPNVRVISSTPVELQQAEGIEVVYTSTGPDGRVMKSWSRVWTANVYGSGAGYILSATMPEESFAQQSETLKALALKIEITDDTAVFGRGPAQTQLANRNLNHPMDHSFVEPYWRRQASEDGISRRGSEVRRDTFMMIDPVTGDKYWVGHRAFRSDGTVANPARPDENLVPPPYWQGH